VERFASESISKEKQMQISFRSVSFFSVVLILLLCFISASLVVFAESEQKSPEPKAIPLDPNVQEYMRILGGPPETVEMHAGMVVLEPGKSVGTHNSKSYEEILICLEGKGKMVITDGPELPVNGNSAVYCPPRTEHNVWNTGKGKLRYIYVVANTEK